MGLATIDPYSQKQHTEIHKIPKFGVNQASFDSDWKNFKINKEIGCVQTASEWPVLQILTFSNVWILLNFGSIYTKLGYFVKLGLHFINMWLNSC